MRVFSPSRRKVGDCVWSPAEDGCDSTDVQTLRAMAKLGEGESDPVCTYMSTLADSGCVDVAFYEECSEHSSCTWQVDEGQFSVLAGTTSNNSMGML